MFIVEGIKSIYDFLSSGYRFQGIYFTPQYAEKLKNIPANIQLFEVNNAEISKISTLQTPQGILAVLHLPQNVLPPPSNFKGSFTLVLDDVQDPGNVGTLIRTADWFGIRRMICSEGTADVFNPKTVQATMGSLARVTVHYTDLPTFLEKQEIPIFGAFLHGEDLYEAMPGDEGFLVLGNEGKGISAEVEKWVNRRLTIPGDGKAESLNVAVSGAIFCSELFRKAGKNKKV